MSEREEELLRQTQGLTDANTVQMKAYEALRDKLVGSIRKRYERISGEAGATGQQGQHIAYLEKMNKDLSTAHSDAAKQNATLQRDLAVVEKQLQARSYVHCIIGCWSWCSA